MLARTYKAAAPLAKEFEFQQRRQLPRTTCGKRPSFAASSARLSCHESLDVGVRARVLRPSLKGQEFVGIITTTLNVGNFFSDHIQPN